MSLTLRPDVIDVARDRMQNAKLNRIDYNAADLIREAVAVAAGGKQVSIEMDGDNRIWADPDRVRQVAGGACFEFTIPVAQVSRNELVSSRQ